MPQQCGLSLSIWTQDAIALALSYCKRCIVKEKLPWRRNREVVDYSRVSCSGRVVLPTLQTHTECLHTTLCLLLFRILKLLLLLVPLVHLLLFGTQLLTFLNLSNNSLYLLVHCCLKSVLLTSLLLFPSIGSFLPLHVKLLLSRDLHTTERFCVEVWENEAKAYFQALRRTWHRDAVLLKSFLSYHDNLAESFTHFWKFHIIRGHFLPSLQVWIIFVG
mmetsp:Transcript_18520/g.43364  ORF Transcript_18520/g.43364 Transcript_18520/m.43364 type:complete len:218 (-) Transcript_18520:816-1469(-)